LLLTPQTLGPYELDEMLGRGPTGEVYRAWDTRRSRTVALEVLSPELSADPRFRARFEQVCRAVAALDEPHVVAVHEFGEIDGRLYRDVQLVDGRPLSAVLAAEGPLPAGVAVDVVGQVAAALDAAHAAGIVHGGVRAADVLLSGHPDRPECHLTHFGYVERPADHPDDRRADVHALAWLLSEVLTGRPRHPGGDTDTRAYGGGGRHREPPQHPGEVSVPPALAAVVARGTAEDPAERFTSAGALAGAARAALRRTSDTVPVPAVPVRAGAVSGAAAGRRAGVGAVAARLARRRTSSPAPRSGHRKQLTAVLVGAAVGLTATGGLVAVRLASDASDAPTSTPVVLEPADAPGEDPFVPAPQGATGPGEGAGDLAPGTADGSPGGEGPAPTSAGTPQEGERPADGSAGTPPEGDDTTQDGAGTASGTDGAEPDTGTSAAGSPVAGDRPGLYGGSGAEVCDPVGMATYLAEHPDRAAAFADVEGIRADGIDEHLAALTPVVLRFDTAVTNHGYADGRAVPFQSVLQAGTAVLVDDTGVPQVRCICGNPLEPSTERPAPDERGDPWPGSSPDQVVVVERSAAPVAEFVLVDDATGAVEARPARTAGEADRAVDAALADRARASGGARPASPTSGGTSSSVPPSSVPSSSVPSSSVPSSADPPAGGSSPPGPSSDGGDPPGRPGRTEGSTPAEDVPAEDAPAEEAPAEDVPTEEAPAPAEEAPAGEAPAEDVPAEEAPAEDVPAEEAPVEGAPAPAEEAPAEELPAEDVPGQEAPGREAPTGETPAGETPAEETPTEEAPAEEAPTSTPAEP
jgi:hypothetical protein